MADALRTTNALRLNSLVTGYGKKQVLNGITLQIASGEIVALIGHNGAGKSTLLKATFGLIPIWSGQVQLNGTIWAKPTPRDLLRCGVVYIPQGNRVFTNLTVRENLEIGGATLPTMKAPDAEMERVFNLFPTLKARLKQPAGTLSGGEKQMLALANALIQSPTILLLDEPSLGLAQPLVSEVLELIRRITAELGVAVLIVEQKVREVLRISQRVYVLRNGHVSLSCSADNLKDDAKLRKVYL